jgi:hypothetical protein
LIGAQIGDASGVVPSGGGGGTENVNLAAVGGTAASLGQKAMAASLPVVIASNQTAVPTSNSTQLPAALGQAAMAASLPVAIASNQSAIPVEIGPYSYSRKTADGQVKATAGFIHTVTISPTGTVTAGEVTIYDSASESGTVIMSISLPVTSFTPFSVQLDVTCGTGIYVGFDATLANVQVTVSYR